MRSLLFLLAAISTFAAEPLRIGVILPLSGNMSNIGQQCREAIQMSYFDIPLVEHSRYKLYFEDDQAELRQGLLAARKLMDLDKVDVLMSLDEGNMKLIAPLAKEKNIIHLNVSISHEFADGRNNFSFWGRASDAVPLVVNQLAAESKKRVAILSVINDPALVQTAAFADVAKKNGLQIVGHEKFSPEERDFRVILLKLRESRPDAIFLYAWPPALDIVARQMRQLGMTTPITTVDTFCLIDDRSLIEGQWYATAASPTPEFQKRFQETFKHPTKVCEGNFYDYLQMIREVCQKYPDRRPAPEEIAQGLRAIQNRPSAMGILSVNDKGQIIVPSHLAEMVQGQIIPLK